VVALQVLSQRLTQFVYARLSAAHARQIRFGGVRATFGEGPEVVPHLYWRDGRVLHTVSGPFAKETLVEVAASLRAVRR